MITSVYVVDNPLPDKRLYPSYFKLLVRWLRL